MFVSYPQKEVIGVSSCRYATSLVSSFVNIIEVMASWEIFKGPTAIFTSCLAYTSDKSRDYAFRALLEFLAKVGPLLIMLTKSALLSFLSSARFLSFPLKASPGFL